MATYDLTNFLAPLSTVQSIVNQAKSKVGSFKDGSSVVVVRNTLDLEDYHNYKQALAAADVLKVLRIPRASMFLGGGIRVVRACDGTSTFAITLTHTTTCSTTCIAAAQTYAPATSGTAIAAGKVGLIAPSTSSPFVMDDSTDDDEYLQATLTTVTTITDYGKYEWFGVFALINP